MKIKFPLHLPTSGNESMYQVISSYGLQPNLNNKIMYVSDISSV